MDLINPDGPGLEDESCLVICHFGRWNRADPFPYPLRLATLAQNPSGMTTSASGPVERLSQTFNMNCCRHGVSLPGVQSGGVGADVRSLDTEELIPPFAAEVGHLPG